MIVYFNKSDHKMHDEYTENLLLHNNNVFNDSVHLKSLSDVTVVGIFDGL